MVADGRIHHGAAISTALFPVMHGEPRRGRLLGVSPAGLYLHFEDVVAAPTVVALLPTSSVRLPLAIVTADPLPEVRLDDPFVVGGGALRVGLHVWRALGWFEPRPPGCGAAEPPQLAGAARMLHGLSDSEVGVDARSAWAAAAALAVGHPEPCRGLLGAGPGLTPAGDDVVAGALAACTLSGAGPSPRAVATLLAGAQVATTALSAALLWCAAAGQVVPQVAVFLRALTGAVPVAPALGQLRAVGSTSGTALAVGIVAALEAFRLDRFDTPLRRGPSPQFDRLGQLADAAPFADSAGMTEGLLP